MKVISATFISIFAISSVASSSPLANGEATLYNSTASYELVLDGKIAEKLYNTLDVAPEKPVKSPTGEWINKVADGITCGQNTKTKNFSCSLSVDESGILF